VADGREQDFVSQIPDAVVWWLEDDVELCRLMHPRLRTAGWQIRILHQPEQMLTALEAGKSPELLVLDRRLPGRTGEGLLQELRRQGHSFPVLMLSALGSPADRILGLEQGAQDYLIKPFHAREMLLRCEQLLRSGQQTTVSPSPRETTIHLGDVVFLPHEGILERPDAERVTLTRGERTLLLALCRAPGRVLTREQLAHASGGLMPVEGSRSIDMRLSRLRRLLRGISHGCLRIETRRAHGYALEIKRDSKHPGRLG
jgi:DNA-binding response OmpR family regulator